MVADGKIKELLEGCIDKGMRADKGRNDEMMEENEERNEE